MFNVASDFTTLFGEDDSEINLDDLQRFGMTVMGRETRTIDGNANIYVTPFDGYGMRLKLRKPRTRILPLYWEEGTPELYHEDKKY